MTAGDKGVQSFDFVDKPVFYKKIQCSVRNRWLGSKSFFAQDIKKIIGPQCTMGLKQDFQNTSAHRGKLQPVGTAVGIRNCDPVADAVAVVMRVKADGIHVVLRCESRKGLDM
jgi:hypothetical protein